MSVNTNIQTNPALPPTVVAGDHTAIRGMSANLNVWLTRSIQVLDLFDSVNKVNMSIAGQLQTLGQQETDQITALSGNNPPTQGWKDGDSTTAPGCPGLQWYLANGDSSSKGNHFQSTVQGIQANISNVQLSFNNQTSTVQTKADIEKDTSSDIETQDSSLLQSMSSGLVSGTQNLASIKIN